MNFNKQVKAKLEKIAQNMTQSKKETITEQAQEFMKLTSSLSEDEKALMVIIYGGLKWDQGYTQGKDDPDFENCEDEDLELEDVA